MIKTAYRLAVDVLDKIAYFVKDYYKVFTLSKRDTNFRNVFSTRKDPHKLREELKNVNNSFLFALFDLSIDLRSGGYYNFVYEKRNILTHRFLVVHDMIISDTDTEDISRVYLGDFIDECILTMQIARSALMYLILMVDVEEGNSNESRYFAPVINTPVEGVFRWTPDCGEL
jgi:hypothetical protein